MLVICMQAADTITWPLAELWYFFERHRRYIRLTDETTNHYRASCLGLPPEICELLEDSIPNGDIPALHFRIAVGGFLKACSTVMGNISKWPDRDRLIWHANECKTNEWDKLHYVCHSMRMHLHQQSPYVIVHIEDKWADVLVQWGRVIAKEDYFTNSPEFSPGYRVDWNMNYDDMTGGRVVDLANTDDEDSDDDIPTINNGFRTHMWYEPKISSAEDWGDDDTTVPTANAVNNVDNDDDDDNDVKPAAKRRRTDTVDTENNNNNNNDGDDEGEDDIDGEEYVYESD